MSSVKSKVFNMMMRHRHLLQAKLHRERHFKKEEKELKQ
jgi:hypothetical protein